MARNCLEKLPHSCGTREGLQVFGRPDGTVDGWCFSCKTYIRHPYGDERKEDSLPKPKKKTEEEIQQEIAEISGYPTVEIHSKKLRKSTLESFGIKTAVSEEDGVTPTMLCYPYHRNGKLVGWRLKTLTSPKRIWGIGDMKDTDFFGWDRALKMGASKLIVTEGEDDAVSWTRVIEMFSRDEFKDLVAVVSLPAGSGSAKAAFAKHAKELKNFKEVMLSFDMDESGRQAVEDVVEVFPNVKSIDIPSKDANQCVIDGKPKALFNCLFQKDKTPKNTRLIRAGDIWDEAAVPAQWGELTWPWDHINQATRGIRYGETIYIGAGVKMGKSELANALASHFVINHKVSVLMAKPEEENKKSIKLLAGKAVGWKFHDPKVEFDGVKFERARQMLDPENKIFLLDIYQHIGWESLRDDIISAVSLGTKVVFIDPITNLTSGSDSGDANIKLEQISKDLSVLAKDLGIVVFIFCHLKAHENNMSQDSREKKYSQNKFIGLGNCAHEFGGDIYSYQFAGSRAMMRSCNMMIGLEGNKDPNLDPNIQRVRHLKILEDREFGVTGIFPLMYNETTTLYSEC